MKRILLLLLILCVPLMGEDKDKPLPKDFKSLKALAEKFSGLYLDIQEHDVEFQPSITFRSIKSLPVSWR